MRIIGVLLVLSVKLVSDLVDLAIERHEQRNKITTTFKTNYLKQF